MASSDAGHEISARVEFGPTAVLPRTSLLRGFPQRELVPLANQSKVLAGRIGGLTTSARHDGKTNTAAARSTFLKSFEDQVDPDRVLSPEERERRALAARRAHMTRLAMKSASSRARSTPGDAA